MGRLGDYLVPKEKAPQDQTSGAENVRFSPSQFNYITFPQEIIDWAKTYYELGFTPMICFRSKNPAYKSWEQFKHTRPPLEYLLSNTLFFDNPNEAVLGIVQTYNNTKYLVIDVDNIQQFQKLVSDIDFDKKTLIEPTTRGLHILVRMENYDPLLLGDKRKIGGIDLLFVHNVIVAPSELNGVKRSWYYMSINEALHCKLTGSWGKGLTREEFALLLENDEILHIDLSTFSLTKRFFTSKHVPSSEQNTSQTDRALLIQQIKNALLSLNEKYHFYQEGLRHEFVLRVSAMARKSPFQFTHDEVVSFLTPFLQTDEEREDRLRAIFSTYTKSLDEINYSDLYTALQTIFDHVTALDVYRDIRTVFFPNTNKPTADSDTKKPKLQRYFELFLESYRDVLYRSEGLLYLWNGRYLEPLPVHKFKDIFLGFVQRMGEVASDYISQQVYYNLVACNEIQPLPEWGRVVAFEDHVFDLDTFTFRPHSANDGNRFIVRANVIPELFYDALRAPTWVERYKFVVDHTVAFKRYVTSLEFDDTTFQQLIEMMGYVALPRRREFNLEACFVLYGEGANGKSTLIELLRRLFDKFYSPVSLSDLEGFRLATLLGAYVNLANEITEKHDKMIAVENFKRTVSWDVMEIPIKFQPHIKASLPLVHIFAVNQKPRFNEFTYAVYRRFNFIHFAKIIPEEERDRELVEKLWNERDYIATVMLLGALKVVTERRLENNVELMNATLIANNPLVIFLLEHYAPATATDSFESAIQKISDIRDRFHQTDSFYRFKNIETFKQALKQAIQFIAENLDASWKNVKVYSDTQHSKEFGGKRLYDVVFPLVRID